MSVITKQSSEFRKKIAALPREDILEILYDQDPDIIKGVNRIEYVFANKMGHLHWSDGTPITERPLTNEELALLVDEPFSPSKELSDLGLSLEEQRKLHIAKDSVLWAKHFLDVKPRVYQILMLRDPSLRKVLRAGRRLGKTVTMSILLLHYSFITKNGRSLVIAPMKSHVELIYQEMMKYAKASPLVMESIARNVTSPQFTIEFHNGSTIRFFTSGMRSGGKCLTPDHDLLTEDGWKPVGDITSDELVMSYENGHMVWKPVTHTWEYDYDGEMISHENQQLSFCVTPNHKFLAKTRSPNSNYEFVEASDLNDYSIPTSGEAEVVNGQFYSGDELELWGWWLAKGSGFVGKMARFSQTKPECYKRLIYLAERLGLHYTTSKREIRLEWRPPIECGSTAYNKFIPRELFEEKERQRLLDGLLGSGKHVHSKGWEYSSSSWNLINDVQELAIRLGLRANMREKDGSDRSAHRHWVVSACPKRDVYVNPNFTQSIQYSGKIHCVTVEDTGVFLTRHNGLVHITGNSDVARGQEAHLIVLDEMDYMHPDDLIALYAMLQKTDENQPDKLLIAASTPTGRQETFWEWCFPADTPIMTSEGNVPIQDIRVGDEIINAYGEKESVSKLFVSQADKLVNIRPWYGLSISSTELHPHLILRDGVEQFVEAKNITLGDYLKIPIRPERSSMIDLSWYLVGTKRREETVNKAYSIYEQIRNMSDLFVLGLYLAEGHLIKDGNYIKGLTWTFNKEEQSLIDSVCLFLDSLNITYKILDRSQTDNTTQVIVWNSALAVLFKELFNERHKKRVPGFIDTLDKHVQDTFIDGALSGDGYCRDGVWSISLTAQEAIWDLYYIRMRMGYISSITESNPKGRKRVLHLRFSKGDRDYVIQRDGNIYVKVRKITEKLTDVEVYNFETSITHTYVANGYATHNCVDPKRTGLFKEFWFPSYCSPTFSKETEDEFRLQYGEMQYRHEVEADWGEDTEGVYPRKYVDSAFKEPGWNYVPELTSATSKYFIGVDWNKYSAGTNMVVLEMPDSKDPRVPEEYQGYIRVCHREEISRDEYSLIKAVDRIIELNYNFRPECIYVDQGYGETQIELLHKHGQENPFSGLKTRVKGINFHGTIDVRDPATKQKVKKELKAFMVDNLRQMLERGSIIFPKQDEELYRQLIAYIVRRVTPTGKPIFESAGSAVDHAHDALILACHAINVNYGELMKTNYATTMKAVSNEAFLSTLELSNDESIREKEEELIVEQWGGIQSAPVMRKRPMTMTRGRSRGRPIKRRMF